MKLLIYEWNSFTHNDIYDALTEEGIKFHIARTKLNARKVEEKADFCIEFEELLKKDSYDAVFSINFFDCIADVCRTKNILYISWAYDSPAMGGRGESHFQPTNRIFLFDSAEVERCKKRGIPNIYHLNLAVNTKRFNRIKVSPLEQLKYTSEISFVGQLYEVEMQEIMQTIEPYSAAYLNALADIQMRNYDRNLVAPLITEGFVDFIKTPELEEKILPWNEKVGLPKDRVRAETIKFLLLRRACNRERILLLGLLSKYHQVKLYSNDRNQILENVKNCGTVDYRNDMPKVFRYSKVNLNSTLRSIEAGIPQRCLDIMGCRGFLVTNYQKDLFEYLENGKDMIAYQSVEEAVDTINYYLNHEEERAAIARNGYSKVKEYFNYHRQLGKIWEVTGLK